MPSWTPRTKLEWFYFGATATQAVVITVIQSIILVVYLKWVNTSVYEVPISYVTSLSLAVTTLGVLYQLVLTLDAYRIKNNIQLFIQCICNICLSVATIMQRRQIKFARDRIIVGENLAKMPFAKNDWKFWERVSPGLIVCIVVSCLCSLAMCALAFALYREFSWALYQQVSPDAKTRQRYTVYQIYLILLKFAPFFLIAFVVVFGLINVHYVQPEFSLTMALIPIALILVGLAVYFVRNENRVGFVMVLVGHTGEIAYLISRLITLFDPKSRHSSTLLKDEMLFLLIVALAFYTFALIVGCICLANFGKGLKPIVLGQVQRKSGLSASDEAYYFQRLNHHVPPTPSSQNGRFQLD